MTQSSTRAMPARLDVATLRDWLASDQAPRVLDVRTAAEFTTAHIPGSYNVPLGSAARTPGRAEPPPRTGHRARLPNSYIMGSLISKLPCNRDASCDLQTVLAELTDTGRD